MALQVPHSTGGTAAASPLSELSSNMQAQLAWIVFMGATVLLALASTGFSVLSNITAAGRQSISFKLCSNFDFPLRFSDCEDALEEFYAPGVATGASNSGSSSSRDSSAAAAWAAAGSTPAWPQLRVRVPQPAPAAASSGCAAAGFDPGTPPHFCRRRRNSLLWTIPE